MSELRVIVAHRDPAARRWLERALDLPYRPIFVTSGTEVLQALAAGPHAAIIAGGALDDCPADQLLDAIAEQLAGSGASAPALILVVDGIQTAPGLGDPRLAYVLNRGIAPADVRRLLDRHCGAAPVQLDEEVAPHVVADVVGHARRLGACTDAASAWDTLRGAVRELTAASRSYCLFHDRDRGCLWTPVDEIDHPAAVGLAGFAARAATPLAVPDVAFDARYVRSVDDPPGRGNECLLLQPIVDDRGQVDAVLIAVRGRGQELFTAADQSALQFLARHAGPQLALLALDAENEALLAAHDVDPLFRPEAVEAAAERGNRGDVVRLSPGWARWTFPVLLLAFVVGLLFVSLGEVEQYSTGAAVVQMPGRTSITAVRPGTIAEVLVSPGQPISAGQPLIRFDDARERAARDRIASEAETQLIKLLRDPGDDGARRALAALTAQRQQADAQLEQTLLVAPRAGVAGDIRARPNQHVAAGDELMSLVGDSGALTVVALMPGGDLPQFQPGMRLRFQPSGYPYAYQSLVIESVSEEVIGPVEATRYFGGQLAGWFRPTGPVALVRARLTSESFEADGTLYSYRDGMSGVAEIPIRSDRIITTLLPGLKRL